MVLKPAQAQYPKKPLCQDDDAGPGERESSVMKKPMKHVCPAPPATTEHRLHSVPATDNGRQSQPTKYRESISIWHTATENV